MEEKKEAKASRNQEAALLALGDRIFVSPKEVFSDKKEYDEYDDEQDERKNSEKENRIILPKGAVFLAMRMNGEVAVGVQFANKLDADFFMKSAMQDERNEKYFSTKRALPSFVKFGGETISQLQKYDSNSLEKDEFFTKLKCAMNATIFSRMIVDERRSRDPEFLHLNRANFFVKASMESGDDKDGDRERLIMKIFPKVQVGPQEAVIDHFVNPFAQSFFNLGVERVALRPFVYGGIFASYSLDIHFESAQQFTEICRRQYQSEQKAEDFKSQIEYDGKLAALIPDADKRKEFLEKNQNNILDIDKKIKFFEKIKASFELMKPPVIIDFTTYKNSGDNFSLIASNIVEDRDAIQRVAKQINCSGVILAETVDGEGVETMYGDRIKFTILSKEKIFSDLFATKFAISNLSEAHGVHYSAQEALMNCEIEEVNEEVDKDDDQKIGERFLSNETEQSFVIKTSALPPESARSLCKRLGVIENFYNPHIFYSDAGEGFVRFETTLDQANQLAAYLESIRKIEETIILAAPTVEFDISFNSAENSFSIESDEKDNLDRISKAMEGFLGAVAIGEKDKDGKKIFELKCAVNEDLHDLHDFLKARDSSERKMEEVPSNSPSEVKSDGAVRKVEERSQ